MKAGGLAGLTLAAALLAAVAPAAAGTFRAGAGKVSITPAADEFPYVVPREKPMVGVHDDVFARALVLDDGTRRAVIVSIEVTAVPDAVEVARAVAAAAKVPPAAVMLVATHTHNVPLTFYHGEVTNPAQPREMGRIAESAVVATRAAVAQLRPARVAWARGEAHLNVNNGEKVGRKGGNDARASSDKSLDILRIQDAGGAPLALLVNYASHAEVMFRSVTKDGGYEVTGDLPGATSRILETAPGGAPVVLFTAAAEGDQLPIFKSLQPAGALPAADEGAGGWALLDVQARRLATSALETVATMPAGAAEATIAVAAGTATCPGQHYDVERPSGRVLGIRDTAPVAIPLATLRINDIALAAVGADLASDLGRAIKAGSPVPHTSVLTMLGGAVGYVLNDAAYREPGHGALGSPVKPGCAAQALPAGVAGLLRGAR